MGELGRLLIQARQARGLTLEAAERDTRIARRYLEALEREDFAALPAPVFARGFLRSYAQYLGLDPAQVLPLMPRETPPPRIQPLPEVGEGVPPAFNASWLVAAVLVITLGVVGFILFRTATPASGGRTATPVTTPPPGETGRQVARGPLPDLRGSSLETAITRLQELGVPYVVVQAPYDGAAPGQVYEQMPRAGTRLDPQVAVALWVARPP